jgi:putative CocE/NonD family hydrolase
MGPADQHKAEVSKMMLVYTSVPLQKAMNLVGDVEVTLFAASTAPDTDFTARLCTVDPEGRSTNLVEGIIRGRHRESLTVARLMTPGDVYEFHIELGPVGAHIPAGWRFRLDIASSDFPQWDRNLNTGGPLFTENVLAARLATQTVLHNQMYPTRVSLSFVN